MVCVSFCFWVEHTWPAFKGDGWSHSDALRLGHEAYSVAYCDLIKSMSLARSSSNEEDVMGVEAYVSLKPISSITPKVLPSKMCQNIFFSWWAIHMQQWAKLEGCCTPWQCCRLIFRRTLTKTSQGTVSRGDIELCWNTDLHATKHMVRAISCSIAVMVAAEWHIWLTLLQIEVKKKFFLLDILSLPFWSFWYCHENSSL